jgi:putative transposase
MQNPFKHFKTSPEIISLAVMIHVRCPLSLRHVEDLRDERGVNVSYETIRYWWNRFGPVFAAEIKKKRQTDARASNQWRWHLDEVFVKINGENHYLWRAVDHEGEVLESFVTKRRDRKVALRFLRKLLKHYRCPKTVVTDKLRSYRAAMKVLGNEHCQENDRWLNNRAENSHQPFRRRKRGMAKFRATKSLQKFVSIHASIQNHFNKERHLNSAHTLKTIRATALREWRQFSAYPNLSDHLIR